MMRDTGMIRVLDSLGRIVIPTEIRMTRNIELGDPLEFFISDDNTIIMRKYKSTECSFCRELNSIAYYKGQFICESCLTELKRIQETSEKASVPSKDEIYGVIDAAREAPEHTLQEAEQFAAASHPETASSSTLSSKKRSKKSEALYRLGQALSNHPGATQKQLAKLLGISQGRVSQLLKEMK